MTDAWGARQRAMMSWYRGLLDDPAAAAREFAREHAPLEPLLAGIGGEVLDLGGGRGLVRAHLAPGARHVCVEPEAEWDDPRWEAVEALVPGLDRPTQRVRATAEALPFGGASFDAALALWSVNHFADPALALREVARVLRPGGRLVIVVEDVEPRWRDLLDPRAPDALAVREVLARTKLSCLLRGRRWPVGVDHGEVSEASLRRWLAPGFVVVARRWLGDDHGLLLEARRR